MNGKFSKPAAGTANKYLSPEELRLLKTGMDKLYPAVTDTDFAELIDRFKKSDDH